MESAMKTMITIPVMYSETEVREILGRVPDDFCKESDEFWSYVENKFMQFASSMNDVYLLCEEREIDPRAIKILDALRVAGSNIHPPRDRALVGEVRAWYLAARDSKLGEEFFEEANGDLNEAFHLLLDSSLADTAVCVTFFEPVCKLCFEKNFRVIRMSPFDPVDYINRHLVTQQISGQQ
ncbi:hypothetical protein MUP37_05660 [Candidatus Bathyarchaeota archaeon]|nr:hypothetical protein [Candidatus Bathyarchaeota archaeon]